MSTKSVSASTALALIMVSTRSTSQGATLSSPYAKLRVIAQMTSPAARRTPSTSVGCSRATNPTERVRGLRRDSREPDSPLLPTSPAEVAMSATPATRSANSAGSCSASAMTAMPPIECATSTSGPSGASARITAARSWPSWSRVQLSRAARSDRPWLRRSKITWRTLGSVSSASAERWKCQVRRSSAKPCTSTTVSAARPTAGSISAQDSRTPSSAVTDDGSPGGTSPGSAEPAARSEASRCRCRDIS